MSQFLGAESKIGSQKTIEKWLALIRILNEMQIETKFWPEHLSIQATISPIGKRDWIGLNVSN